MAVKVKKRGRPAKENAVLSKGRIIERAKAMMVDKETVLSIRKLASELNVDPMAIYYYFNNKGALLEGITVSLMTSIYEPTQSPDWKRELLLLCKSYLQMLCQYPGVLEILLSTELDSPSTIFITRFERIVRQLHLTPERQKNALDLMVDYVHGFALAMNCNPNSTLNMDHMNGPFYLFCNSLESHQAD